MIIFLSYSSKDRSKVETLAKDLRQLGHTVWFDAELIHTGGQKWWDNILERIRGCDLFVFVLSVSSLDSTACQREYRYAHALNKRILPMLVTEKTLPALPYELQEIQIMNYRQRSIDEVLALAGSLSNLPPVRDFPDPLPKPPEAPISPHTRITSQLEAPILNKTEQIEMLFELETLFQALETRSVAEVLLRRLYKRDDLVMQVGNKIRILIPNIEDRQSTNEETPKQKPEISRRSVGPNISRVTLPVIKSQADLKTMLIGTTWRKVNNVEHLIFEDETSFYNNHAGHPTWRKNQYSLDTPLGTMTLVWSSDGYKCACKFNENFSQFVEVANPEDGVWTIVATEPHTAPWGV